MSAATGKSALVLGATGATGKHLLRDVLASPEFTRVGEYGRRVTSSEAIAGLAGREKLEQRTMDYEKLGESGLKGGRWDVVYVAMGTTRAKAGSAEAFTKIDREYVVNAAKEAKTDDPTNEQRLVYLSSTGANASSPFLYPKSKGLTELELAGLGYKETIVFRPAFLKGAERPDHRIAESIFGCITGILSTVSSSMEIPIQLCAKSICNAGRLGVAGLPASAQAEKAGKEGAWFTLINNAGAINLGKADV
ncbi:hypothetical protein CONPUDRAFT_132147 [Coniophora puteana RWD-64-598 SS2]|uniref:NAD-dependent epimerase/dehydratase domain-containing protein n=1 Tax=Coniophora puteana (strain RWD-64-598) TaxID=741705 RepID=A0A5M3M8K2_CONPW|nr:uncharacterized protein CONPUDRAFT_132147 [Coniophora puteana RWD-64-598 SS2]EIW75204.1 hypothetical protein CONPUDRAFT_132147 [Coniophora puteana RWD-64-598 SS2]